MNIDDIICVNNIIINKTGVYMSINCQVFDVIPEPFAVN